MGDDLIRRRKIKIKRGRRRKKRLGDLLIKTFRLRTEYEKRRFLDMLVENYLRKKLGRTRGRVVSLTYPDFQRNYPYRQEFKITPRKFWRSLERVLAENNISYTLTKRRKRKTATINL